MITLSKRLSLLLMLAALSSCAQAPKPTPVKPIATAETEARDACKVWKPVLYSRLHDTVETIEQVKLQNTAHDAFCEAPPH